MFYVKRFASEFSLKWKDGRIFRREGLDKKQAKALKGSTQ